MMSLTLVQRLLIILAAVGLLSFAARRGWITALETILVGVSMIFCAAGWVLQSVLLTMEGLYPGQPRALWESVGLTIPLVVAMGSGLFVLVRRVGKAAGQAESQK
jgi:hypothetical protein